MSAVRNQPLRAAIVGPGYIGAIHIEAVRRCGAEVALIVGRAGSDLATRATALRVTRYSDRLEDALADPTIDVVHICTPNALHYAMARAVLEHGKHLVCEKPLTIDAAQAMDLVRLAAAAGVVAGVAYCYRYYPLVAQARHFITAGTLGRVHQVRGAYLADELLNDAYLHYRFDPASAGPLLSMLDVGVHWCDLAEYITGQRIVEVFADMQTVIPTRIWRHGTPGAGPRPERAQLTDDVYPMDITGEDCLSLLAHFDGGMRGNTVISQVSVGFKNWIALSIDGAEAGVDWNQEQPNTLTIRRRHAWEVLPRDPTLLAPEAAALAHTPGGHPEGYLDAFRNLIGQIYDAIEHEQHGEATYPTLADGWHSIAVAEAAHRSSQERRWVAVDEAAG